MYKVEINSGHGGKDSGAIGNDMKEKDVTLPVGLKIGKILSDNGVKVTYTRTTDVFVELGEIAHKANRNKVDAFVSIHCNAVKNVSAQGFEIFHFPGSKKGFELSKAILDSIVADKLYTKNRGVKTANFAVLKHTKMPSSLIELGFITNKEDAAILKNKQDELALSVAKGVLKNAGIPYKGYVPNGPYPAAIKVLSEHGIIGTPGAWEDASKIKPGSARALVIKMADYITLNR